MNSIWICIYLQSNKVTERICAYTLYVPNVSCITHRCYDLEKLLNKYFNTEKWSVKDK